MSDINHAVHINVGGVTFAFTQSAIHAEEGSMLAAMLSHSSSIRPSELDSNGAFLFQDDPITFAHIWRHLHGEPKRLDLLTDTGLRELWTQCDFFQLTNLASIVQKELEVRDNLVADLLERATKAEAKIVERDFKISTMEQKIKNYVRNEWHGCRNCVKPFGHIGKCKIVERHTKFQQK